MQSPEDSILLFQGKNIQAQRHSLMDGATNTHGYPRATVIRNQPYIVLRAIFRRKLVKTCLETGFRLVL